MHMVNGALSCITPWKELIEHLFKNCYIDILYNITCPHIKFLILQYECAAQTVVVLIWYGILTLCSSSMHCTSRRPRVLVGHLSQDSGTL